MTSLLDLARGQVRVTGSGPTIKAAIDAAVRKLERRQQGGGKQHD